MIRKALVLVACYQALLVGATNNCNTLEDSSHIDVIGEFKGPTAIAAEGAYTYVCNLVAASVSVVRISCNAVVATIQDPTMTAPFQISIINGYAYVCNLNSNTISIIDTTNNTFVRTVSDGIQASNGITTASVLGTDLAFVVGLGVMQVLDLTSPTNPIVVQTFSDLNINGLGVSVGGAPDYSVYVTATSEASQGQILVYSQRGGQYSSTATAMVPPTVQNGRLLSAITTVGSAYAYVCDQLNDVVQVYDLERECYLTSVKGFNVPTALASNGTCVYVCNFGAAPLLEQHHAMKGSGNGMSVSVIDASNHKIKGNLTGFCSPQAIAILPGFPDTLYVVEGSMRLISDTGSAQGGVTRAESHAVFKENRGVFSPNGVF